MDYSNASCLIIIVLSHGGQEDLALAKDAWYKIMSTTIVPIMTYNKTIKLVPKLILTQACKGPNQIMIESQEDCEDMVDFLPEESKLDSTLLSKLPVNSGPGIYRLDATFEGDAATRNIESGSYFIQSLCKMLKKHGDTEKIQDIAMKVKGDVMDNLR